MLEYFTIDNLKGVEIMKAGKYSSLYASGFEGIRMITEKVLFSNMNQDAWIEVTTRTGKGPFVMPMPGMFLYKTMPFAGSRQFYSPKYPIKDTAVTVADHRSTIHWEPDIITNAEGKATISFYSADTPGSYTVIAEGSDMNGSLGSTSHTIKISP